MSNISNLNLRSSLEKTNKSICQKSPRTLLGMAGDPQKNPYSGSRVTRTCNFGTQNDLIAQSKFFFEKTINIIFMYLLPTFIVQNLKAKLRVDQNYLSPNKISFMYQLFPFVVQNFQKVSLSGSKTVSVHHFRAKKGIFALKPIHKPCSFHLFLSTFKKLKSDINPLMKY